MQHTNLKKPETENYKVVNGLNVKVMNEAFLSFKGRLSVKTILISEFHLLIQYSK